MAEIKVYTVFLPVQQRKMLKVFKKVTDPTSRKHAAYGEYDYFDSRWEVAARSFFRKFKGAALRKTYFPGVLRLVTTKQERRRHFVPPFYRVKEELDFDKIEGVLKSLSEVDDVHLLQGNFSASRKLKKRVNLALMDLGLQGKSVFSPMSSFFGEMPALTSYNDGSDPQFSYDFKRKKYAFYQDFLVRNYLLDPLIVKKLKEYDFPFQGRACPDIYLDDPLEFMECVKLVNSKNKKKVGFLNPILYSNAKIFLRDMELKNSILPSSVTLWRPYFGLGKPEDKKFLSLF